MMPRPMIQYQTRLAIARVNQGFLGVINQSAKTSRGSRSGDNLTFLPSGNAGWGAGTLTAGGGGGAAGAVAVGDGFTGGGAIASRPGTVLPGVWLAPIG